MSVPAQLEIGARSPSHAPANAPVSLVAVKSLLRGLNREQRQAVTHTGGPCLVIAGPGTGKTEVITRRVAWLIAAKLARPREILALTFTDNAAHEMQARVDVLVPYGQADAAIHTFHAFGDRLLREHAFELGLAGDVRLINRYETIALLRDNVFALGLERYMPLADPTRFLGALVDLFGRAKDEDIGVEAFEDHASALAAAAVAERADEALADVAAARAELARAYRRYCALLASHGLIDHADQVALALRLTRQRPAVRAEVEARYRFVLVDELQDANRAQMELVTLVAGSTANITFVGDPDQGIYTFRGALSGNVARFAAGHNGLRRIVLRRNYRSRAPIVESGARLIEHNVAGESRAGWRQVANRRSRHAPPVRCRVYATPDQEADGIADEIASRVARGARPDDFAVLLRSNAEADAVLRSLRVRGVPAESGVRPSLLELPAVRSLLAFMRVLADPSNSLELYALAAGDPYRLSGAELNGRLQVARRRHRPLLDVLTDAMEGDPGLLDGEARRRVGTLLEHVNAGLAMSAAHSTGEVLYDYLRRSGMLARLARLSGDGPDIAGLRGVARFVELVRSTASLLAHDRVALVVPHLGRLTEAHFDQPTDGPSGDSVTVLTVHRAKGLEFKVVYLAGLVDGRFPVRGRRPLISLPAELLPPPDGDDDLAEERRLFYVALTRARDELWLSYHVNGPNGRGRRRPSPFIAEAMDAPPALVAPAPTPPDAATQVSRLTRPDPPSAPPRPPADGSLSLSFSQVDEYLGCPERYRLRHVVGLPTPGHHALAYGSALHQTIATFHARRGQGVTPSEDELLAEFARNWNPEGFLSREHEEARYAAGRETLRTFRTQQLASGVDPIAIERPFRFRLGQDQIVGRVDRLDRAADGVVITDYKSSDVRDQRRADTKARDSLQLRVYALAHQAETGELPARVQLHFLDSAVIGSAKPEPERLEQARQTLTDVADGIRGAQFAPRPNPIACGYCPFREICPASVA